MGKRSDFERNPRDYYQTPPEALLPVLPYLPRTNKVYCEPCAGDGALISALSEHDFICAQSFDIDPQSEDIQKGDALKTFDMLGDFLITNPPWEKRPHKGEVFNKLLYHWLCTFDGDIWLLFDADWQHTVQAQMFKKRCEMIVSVGRISWMQNGDQGKDNCAWYKFNHAYSGETAFKWRE